MCKSYIWGRNACTILLAAVIALAGCTVKEPVQQSSKPDVGKGVFAPFNVTNWFENTDNAKQFQYIDIAVYPDTWDRGLEPIAHIEADKDDEQFIRDALADVIFSPAQPWEEMTVDFSFAMNEPFLFFSFTDEGLHVKEPWEGDSDYLYHSASFEDWPKLYDVKEYIGEMRLGYYLGGK